MKKNTYRTGQTTCKTGGIVNALKIGRILLEVFKDQVLKFWFLFFYLFNLKKKKKS